MTTNGRCTSDLENQSRLSVFEHIERHVIRLEKGVVFSANKLAKHGSRRAVSSAIYRLCKKGTLIRVVPGVYMRPLFSPVFGWVVPSSFDVAALVAMNDGGVVQIHGVEAARKLGLSTQMQVNPIYFTNKKSRDFYLGNLRVRLERVPEEWVQLANSYAGLVLTAFYYVGRDGLCQKDVERIVGLLREEDKQKLSRAKIPDWMRNMIQLAIERWKG